MLLFYFVLFINCLSLGAGEPLNGIDALLINDLPEADTKFHPNKNTKDDYEHELAITAIFQNEAPYLKEWIEFHKLVGVEHFYLYNNLSTDNFQEVLEPYIKNNEVDLIEWPYTYTEWEEWNRIQRKAYEDAIKRTKKTTKWVAFLDIDEFLFPVKMDDLREFLRDYDEFAGVRANWQCYGTSNVKKIPPNELLTSSLLMKAEKNHQKNETVKSIVKPKWVQRCPSVHSFSYKSGHFAVDSNKTRRNGARQTSILIDKIRINHYWTRDEYFFEHKKIQRRKKFDNYNEEDKSIHRASKYNEVEDPAILRFVPELKRRMGL